APRGRGGRGAGRGGGARRGAARGRGAGLRDQVRRPRRHPPPGPPSPRPARRPRSRRRRCEAPPPPARPATSTACPTSFAKTPVGHGHHDGPAGRAGPFAAGGSFRILWCLLVGSLEPFAVALNPHFPRVH